MRNRHWHGGSRTAKPPRGSKQPPWMTIGSKARATTPDAEQQEACIALEIHIEVDSPPEDKDARMAYQMKRLVEGMGSGQTDDALRLLELINEFIAMRPSSEWLERFSQGIEKAVPESR